MKKLLLLCLIFFFGQTNSWSQNARIMYELNDSIRIEKMLKEARHLPVKTNKVLYFAKKFLNVPYVAHTLEKGDPERLVINLNELDCTTYIDVITALTLASKNNKTTFKNFCQYLQKQRYPKGIIKNYASRNHYYTSWILNGEKEEFVHEITDKDCKGLSPFYGKQKLNINFMSKHPNFYPALQRHPELIKAIKTTESELTGLNVSYIPISELGKSQEQLNCINNGDILALVTAKEGLDVAHLGFAVWQDKKLHLLNASSLYKKVLIDKNTLQDYMSKQPKQLGIRVIRILH